MRPAPGAFVLNLVLIGALSASPGVVARTGAGAQEQAAPAESQEPEVEGEVKLGADLVVLDVSVVDRANHPVYNIPRERFTVLEDGDPQKIEFFSPEMAPVSLAFVIDTSGSMKTKLETVSKAASTLLRANKPDDEVAVIEFKTNAELIEEFTTNEHDVEDAIADMTAHGQTSLLDAIALSADYVQRDGRHRRKAIVVVSDGVEKGSYYSAGQVIDRLRKLDVRLYLIGFTDDVDEAGGVFKKSDKEKAEELLRKLAQETGGRAFFPTSLADLEPINGEIARDLRTVYSIGYYPTNTRKDGGYRKVEVKIAGDSKLVARTRAGYQAGMR